MTELPTPKVNLSFLPLRAAGEIHFQLGLARDPVGLALSLRWTQGSSLPTHPSPSGSWIGVESGDMVGMEQSVASGILRLVSEPLGPVWGHFWERDKVCPLPCVCVSPPPHTLQVFVLWMKPCWGTPTIHLSIDSLQPPASSSLWAPVSPRELAWQSSTSSLPSGFWVTQPLPCPLASHLDIRHNARTGHIFSFCLNELTPQGSCKIPRAGLLP